MFTKNLGICLVTLGILGAIGAIDLAKADDVTPQRHPMMDRRHSDHEHYRHQRHQEMRDVGVNPGVTYGQRAYHHRGMHPRRHAAYPQPVYYSHPWSAPFEYDAFGVAVILGPAVYGYPASGPTPYIRHKKRAHYKKVQHISSACSQVTHKVMTNQGIEYRSTKRCGS